MDPLASQSTADRPKPTWLKPQRHATLKHIADNLNKQTSRKVTTVAH